MSKSQFIDWSSQSTHLILNPKLPVEQKKNLSIVSLPYISGHVWLASSGASGEALGRLKLFALSKSAFLISAVAVNTHLHAQSSDVWLNVLPHFHVGGLSIFARAYISGSKIIDRGSELWSPEKFHSWTNDVKASLTSLVPTQLYDLVKLAKPAPLSLRAIVIGGAALNSELYLEARALGYNVLPSYGMTECCSQIATATLASLSKAGYPDLEVLPHVELKKMDSANLAIKSSALFTAKALWLADDSLGQLEVLWRAGEWYVTQDFGDIENIENIESVRLLGRNTDEVKISGELVNLAELNSKFKKIVGASGLSDFYIFSQPDARRGAEVVAVFKFSLYNQAEAWIAKFNAEVLPIAKIRASYFIDELPKSELGKIKLAELRHRLRI